MSLARDFHGSVFERGSATLLARIVDSDGSAIPPGAVASVRYTISPVDSSGAAAATAVPGHDSVSLSPATVLFDSLQTGSIWTVDATGYNFGHQVNVGADEAFPEAGVAYQVRYELFPVQGQKIVFRFLLKAI